MPAFNYKEEYERYKKYYLSVEPVVNKPQNQAYTAVILSFLAVSLFGWYAIRPTMQTIFTLKREISDRTTVDTQMENKISALIEAQANYENIQNSLPILSQALPVGPEPIRGVAQLSGLAAANGVSMTALSVPDVLLANPTPAPVAAQTTTPLPSAGGKISILPITLVVSGPYDGVKGFIVGINNLRRIMQITSMSFTKQQVQKTVASTIGSGSATLTSTSTVIQVELKLNVFYLAS